MTQAASKAPHRVAFKSFTAAEHATWGLLFERQAPLRQSQIVPLFSRGILALGLDAKGVPDLERVNARLRERTGFAGVPVEGFEDVTAFFPMLARREFPIGNFIRDPRDLSYTPAPDVFHDLYGHLPFLIDERYADFCAEFGRRASRWLGDPVRLHEFERLFWFTIEFALTESPEGRRIFGAGIASSHGECRYALSDEPEVVPFDAEVIRRQPFRIDEFQKRLFLLRDPAQLYDCLEAFEQISYNEDGG